MISLSGLGCLHLGQLTLITQKDKKDRSKPRIIPKNRVISATMVLFFLVLGVITVYQRAEAFLQNNWLSKVI